MSSTSSDAWRPQGTHRAPRRGGRTLTNRRIRISPERRKTIDVHHLGRALLRLAQEQYDAGSGSTGGPHPSPPEAPERPHEARTRARAPMRASGLPGRTDGPTE